ncbi:hypothetical protein LSAT2_020570 [Lamellibrachia satsuma]|nr:hypothetical protein LSAT2_020570 [Lamellibrachia satsuma]
MTQMSWGKFKMAPASEKMRYVNVKVHDNRDVDVPAAAYCIVAHHWHSAVAKRDCDSLTVFQLHLCFSLYKGFSDLRQRARWFRHRMKTAELSNQPIGWRLCREHKRVNFHVMDPLALRPWKVKGSTSQLENGVLVSTRASLTQSSTRRQTRQMSRSTACVVLGPTGFSGQ